jgi:hypothetical protein
MAHVLHMHCQQASLDPDDQLAVEQSPLNASGVRGRAGSEEGVDASTTSAFDGLSSVEQAVTECKIVTKAAGAIARMPRRATWLLLSSNGKTSVAP